jgi:protein-disulfide isomerase
MITRRTVLSGLGGAAVAMAASRARGQEAWYPVTGDDGKPVPNMRLPVELTSEIDELPGVVWVGSPSAEITLFEFFDYNCPYCRKAARELPVLMRDMPSLRLGLINNPVLSPMSAEAAKVELALLGMAGSKTVYDFHQMLFERRGTIDQLKALDAAETLGKARKDVEQAANGPDVAERLATQMRLAASLGFAATPSFSMAGAGVLGYPGLKSLSRMMNDVAKCDRIAC